MSDNFFEMEENLEPVGYTAPETLEVKLSSCGKLSAPPVLRVTDYLVEDTAKLASATSSNIIQLLIEVLQARVQDDFDVRLLHENEFEEILLHMYANFWSRLIVDYPFPWIEADLEGMSDEEKNAIRSGRKVLRTDIDLGMIESTEIPDDFKEPIVVSKDGKSFGLRLPRVGDYILVESKLQEKFASDDKRFSDIKFKIDQGGKTVEEAAGDKLISYMTYEKARAIEFLTYKQAIMLQFMEENGQRRILTTMEEKLQAYRHMPRKFWGVFTEKAAGITFGINKMVKMINPITRTSVVRRCQFQILEFIPTDDTSDSAGFTVQFGDESK